MSTIFAINCSDISHINYKMTILLATATNHATIGKATDCKSFLGMYYCATDSQA
jgi:hypothetical protein